jgi:restriction endonuclease S subunit
MTEIPGSWKSKALSEVCELITDGSHFSPRTQHEGIPYITVRDLDDEGIDFDNCKYISQASFDELEKNGCRPKAGDVLFSKDGTVGKVALVKDDTKFVVLSSLAILRPNINLITSEYLKYALMSPGLLENALGMKTGTALRRVVLRNLKTLQIPIPPIKEQLKVVELLDDYLSRLDVALAEVTQAKVKAAQFRRSFVHEMTTAIEGSEVMRVLDICDVYQPKTISTKELIADGEFPVYGANGQIGFYDKFNHEDSEVTVTCRGATCGTVNVIPAMSWITGNAMVFKPKDSRIQKGFLEYVLRGMDWTSVITGTAQPQITRTSIQDVFVNVPSPDVQSEIYMKLESSMTQVTSAALLSEKVEMQATSLRRSLLQAAFTGQLTNEVVSV